MFFNYVALLLQLVPHAFVARRHFLDESMALLASNHSHWAQLLLLLHLLLYPKLLGSFLLLPL